MQPFLWTIRVYYEDTDVGGVVYHAKYLHFLERARTELLRAKGIELDDLKNQHQRMFVIHGIEIKYLQPAKFNELLEVHTEITEIKRASLTFVQRIKRGEHLLCKATVDAVFVDVENIRPQAIPQDLIAYFQE